MTASLAYLISRRVRRAHRRMAQPTNKEPVVGSGIKVTGICADERHKYSHSDTLASSPRLVWDSETGANKDDALVPSKLRALAKVVPASSNGCSPIAPWNSVETESAMTIEPKTAGWPSGVNGKAGEMAPTNRNNTQQTTARPERLISDTTCAQ